MKQKISRNTVDALAYLMQVGAKKIPYLSGQVWALDFSNSSIEAAVMKYRHDFPGRELYLELAPGGKTVYSLVPPKEAATYA